MNKKDMFIKEKIQQDKEISDSANKIFENLKEEFRMNNNDKKVIKISFNKFLAIAASFVLVLFVGTNLYAHSLGKPNIFTAIKNLFNVDKEDYNAAEEDINITVESNGVKLTLKTAAMDDNVLIVKYVAEGEKLEKEFYTYQDFEEELIKINKIKFKLVGIDIGTKEYDSYNLKDVTKMTQAMIEKLKELGLTDEDTREIENLGLDAYEEYVGVQLTLPEYSEEEAKTQVEQTIAMFESKVTSKYEIITSQDKLSQYNIQAIAQSIEKEENKYVIHAIYNVDTLVDILEKFNLNLQINKIGSIEGKWDYSVELSKAKLNKRVETIDFYNNYEVIIDSENDEQVEGSNLKVALKQLSISDFSSILNIKTIKEDYYSKIDYNNLENNIFPITFVVLDENDKVIGTSCQTREEAIDANPIVDRIILKDVDYNTEKITVKMYSNNDNKLIETLEVNLKEAKKLMDTSLDNIYYNSEIGGIMFNYPKDWVQAKNVQDLFTSKLLSPENLDGKCAYLEICYDNAKNETKYNSNTTIKENGELLIGVPGVKGEYFVEAHGEEKWKVIIVVVDGTRYTISFGGDEKLYAKYESIFEEILKTVTFSEVTVWKEMEEQNKPSNEMEQNTNINNEENTNVNKENTTVLYGDVNCDGIVNEEDVDYLAKYLAKWEKYEIYEQGKANADIYQDGVINIKDHTILERYLANWEGYETLPYIPETGEEEYNKNATSLSWTEYWAPGIKFQYPSEFILEEVGGYYRGNNQGKISTIIKGVVKGIDSNTKESVVSNMEISIYEPLYLRDFDESVTIDTNSSVITNKDGMEWRVYGEISGEGNIVYTYTSYRISNNGDKSSAWEFKIVFNVIPNGSGYLTFDIMNTLIGTTDITSY